MTQDILATEISLARDEFLTETQLQQIVRTGTKRRLKKVPETVEAVQVESVAEVQQITPAEPEVPADPWDGFSPQMKQLIGHFEVLEENHVLDRQMRELIDLAENGQSVADFDRFTDNQLANFVDTIRTRLPRINQDMREFMQKVSTVRALTVEPDFI